ncbi:MAG: type IX secretion system membrane protein PorP/SprF [Bacteroidetes bacterium]|nr:MAG: type IX secretion system membrane protein PorP/SprF [Bacteroidota bacterium]
MKKLILSAGLLLTILGLTQAQDEALFMHYNISPILVNPAAAGFDEDYQIQFNARMQWTGFEDSPRTFQARYNGPLGPKIGLGLAIMSESAAQLNRTKVHLDYAYRFNIKEDWKMSFGFYTSFQRLQVDNSITSSAFYEPADAVLEEMLNGQGEFDAGIAIYGRYQENTFGGLTFNNLVIRRLSNIPGLNTENEPFFRYYTFMLGQRFELNDPKISLEPSIMMRQIWNTPFQMDLNLKAGFMDDQLIAGLSYRTLGAMGILLGTRLENFNLYYSYDVSFQRFQKFNTGSHELTVALRMQRKTRKERLQNQ